MEARDVEQLVRRAQHADVRAFEELVADQSDKLRRFALAYARNEHEADDLAQETLLRAYLAIGSYRFESAFSAWLLTIARNCFFDFGRSRQGRTRAAERPLDDRAAAALLSQEATADELVEQAEDESALWAAIRRLSAEFRSTLVLVDIEGLPYHEVALIEGIAVGTVKSRLNRARAQLRGMLQNDRSSGNPEAANFVSPREGIGTP